MTTNEIIAMAREAGFRTGQINLSNGPPVPFIAPASGTNCMVELERFADLVAAKEREACAQVCDAEAERALFNWHSDLPSNQQFWNGAAQLASACSSAIRARGRHVS